MTRKGGQALLSLNEKGGKGMNYKSVIEEQIRELQKMQDSMVKDQRAGEACQIALTISSLIELIYRQEM